MDVPISQETSVVIDMEGIGNNDEKIRLENALAEQKRENEKLTAENTRLAEMVNILDAEAMPLRERLVEAEDEVIFEDPFEEINH